MNKIVPGVILSAIILGITVVSFQQYNLAEHNAKQLAFQGTEMSYLEENLNLQIKENGALEEENYFLEEQLKGARDSVALINSKLATLKKSYNQQQKELRSAQNRLQQMKQQYVQLQAQLSKADEVPNNQAAIEQLKAEKRSLLQEMLGLRKQLAKSDLSIDENPISKFLPDNSNEVTPSESDIDMELLKTQVTLQSVSLRKRKMGKSLKRISKKSDWKYTILNLTLEHPEPTLLDGQNFKAKIVETHTGNVLSFVESNPTFPNSSLDSKGIGFVYHSKNVELTYYNADQKTAKDYHLEVFMVDNNGTEHTLPGGKVPIIKRGKTLQ